MLLLAVDTSTPSVSVALVDTGAAGAPPLAEREAVAANRHGELLAPLVDAVLRAGGRARAELAAVAVGLGPGPFTGLRVGVVTVAALADALGVPAYGACSLDVLAAAHTADTGPGGLLVLTDARRRQVYWAAYDARGTRVAGPDVGDPAEVAAGAGAGLVACGAGALLHRDRLGDLPVVERDPYPQARVLAAAVAERVRARAAPDVLEPLYLRRPDARPPGPPKQVTPA